MRDAESKPTLLFTCDWAAEFPLWNEIGRGADPVTLGLGDALRSDLLEFQAFYDEYQPPGQGWVTREALEQFEMMRTGLRGRLEAELGDRYRIVESRS